MARRWTLVALGLIVAPVYGSVSVDGTSRYGGGSRSICLGDSENTGGRDSGR